jgi:hypothetical protein
MRRRGRGTGLGGGLQSEHGPPPPDLGLKGDQLQSAEDKFCLGWPVAEALEMKRDIIVQDRLNAQYFEGEGDGEMKG